MYFYINKIYKIYKLCDWIHIVGKKLFLKRSVLQGNIVNLFPYLKLHLCSLAREGGIKWLRRESGCLILSNVFMHKASRLARNVEHLAWSRAAS
jgi:hypothetical protein